MPDVTQIYASLEGLDAAQLELRRRELVAQIGSIHVDDVPIGQLRELSALTAQLRRKSAGPPKAAGSKAKKATGATKKATVSDIFDTL